MRDSLCRALHPELDSAPLFLQHNARSIVLAFATRSLTFESDRDAACTTVARSILARKGVPMSPQKLLEACWSRVFDEVIEGRIDDGKSQRFWKEYSEHLIMDVVTPSVWGALGVDVARLHLVDVELVPSLLPAPRLSAAPSLFQFEIGPCTQPSTTACLLHCCPA